MARTKKSDSEQPQVARILPGTPEMEAFLGVGYDGMTVEKANAIIEERKKNPALWPYDIMQKAQAFLAAYNATPVAIDKAPHWERSEG